MASTLEDVRRKTEKTVLATLERQSHELAAEEAAIADARIRFETERLLECYDVLSLREVRAVILPSSVLLTASFVRPQRYVP